MGFERGKQYIGTARNHAFKPTRVEEKNGEGTMIPRRMIWWAAPSPDDLLGD